MSVTSFMIHRRAVLAGIGGSLLRPSFAAQAQTRTLLALNAVAGSIALKPGQPPTSIWQLVGGPDAGPLRFKRGESVDVTLTNRLPLPVVLNWTGLDGNPAGEPLTGQPAIAPNASATTSITFRHAGTMLADIRLLGDAQALTSTARTVIVAEADPPAIDRDEVLLFQDWRFKPDGASMALGADAADPVAIFTVNGAITFDITADRNQRLRLRLINSSHTHVIAIKIADYDVRVAAIDSQPSEPFLARDGLVVLTPGSRVDVLVDAIRPPGSTSSIMLLDGHDARPIGRLLISDATPARAAPLPTAAALPSNGLPEQLDLKSALRVNLPLNDPNWLSPSALTSTTPTAFKAKRGRTVMIALANRGLKPVVFHIHGHHFRLLDRLDDGWKPYWLDTIAINAGQTQRIAFLAEFPGLYPMQTMVTEWAATRLVRSYLVE